MPVIPVEAFQTSRGTICHNEHTAQRIDLTERMEEVIPAMLREQRSSSLDGLASSLLAARHAVDVIVPGDVSPEAKALSALDNAFRDILWRPDNRAALIAIFRDADKFQGVDSFNRAVKIDKENGRIVPDLPNA